MHITTFSLRQLDPTPTFTDTARDIIADLQKMSTTTKARLEFFALVFGLLLTVASALKVFVFLPPRVDALEKADEKRGDEIHALQLKTAATDVAIAGIIPKLDAIDKGVGDIKADVREIRAKAK